MACQCFERRTRTMSFDNHDHSNFLHIHHALGSCFTPQRHERRQPQAPSELSQHRIHHSLCPATSTSPQYRGRSCFKIILLVVIMTFANSTVVFVLTSYNISTQFQLAPSVFASNSAFQCDPDPEPRYLRPLFMLQMLTVDSFTIYRTWLLYNKRSSVIIFPILCALVLFGSILCNIPSVPVFNSTFLHYYLTIPISLTLNTLCTVLIAIRLRRVHLETFQVIKFSPSQFVVLSGTIHNLL
ncbi:hypothetical protein SISSUDRAFT_716461 [Sistotremastrum suecicum HHB10207 ss-3]|uniref:Uncharacterized protein n=1 Tax=Sistotremastrum suecicum HHB10207 ss-3 TaxID=1314776 RepID=A0A166DQ43_9AGAM|nr:hypothetical protein SISSUDRAFT_716461 [Sistotremastrum suecicum HHB10207 ss-3]